MSKPLEIGSKNEPSNAKYDYFDPIEALPDDPIFEEELKKSDIDAEELAFYLHDGKEKHQQITKLAKIYAHDPIVKFEYSFYDMDRKELFETMIRKIMRLKEVTYKNGLPPISYVDYDQYGPPMNALMTTSLHHGMFETILRILGSEEQVKDLLPKVLSYEILG
jgi:hypothetical protein